MECWTQKYSCVNRSEPPDERTEEADAAEDIAWRAAVLSAWALFGFDRQSAIATPRSRRLPVLVTPFRPRLPDQIRPTAQCREIGITKRKVGHELPHVKQFGSRRPVGLSRILLPNGV